MKQGPLFKRQSLLQAAGAPVSATEAGSDCLYVRLSGTPTNPGEVLHEQRLFLAPGGVLDFLSASNGGLGIGRVAYTPGLLAAIKRGSDAITYRFEVPVTAARGTTFHVAVHGHDALAAFRFAIQVGQR